MGWNCHVCNTQQDNPSNGATPSTGYTFPLGMEEWLRVENDRFQCDLIWMVCPQIRSNTGKTTWIKWFQKLVSHFPHEETQCRVKNTFWICIYIYTLISMKYILQWTISRESIQPITPILLILSPMSLCIAYTKIIQLLIL